MKHWLILIIFERNITKKLDVTANDYSFTHLTLILLLRYHGTVNRTLLEPVNVKQIRYHAGDGDSSNNLVSLKTITFRFYDLQVSQ